MDSSEVMAMSNATLDSNLNFKYDLGNIGGTSSVWSYWTDWYYPSVIRESYPVYISERAKDKGKQAFEIVKILKDKKLVQLSKVADFIDIMGELIKIL